MNRYVPSPNIARIGQTLRGDLEGGVRMCVGGCRDEDMGSVYASHAFRRVTTYFVGACWFAWLTETRCVYPRGGKGASCEELRLTKEDTLARE